MSCTSRCDSSTPLSTHVTAGRAKFVLGSSAHSAMGSVETLELDSVEVAAGCRGISAHGVVCEPR